MNGSTPPHADPAAILAAFERDVAAWPAAERDAALRIARAVMGNDEAERQRVKASGALSVLSVDHFGTLMRVLREIVEALED